MFLKILGGRDGLLASWIQSWAAAPEDLGINPRTAKWFQPGYLKDKKPPDCDFLSQRPPCTFLL